MKRIIALMALVAALVCISSCKAKETGPKDVAKAAIEAVKKGDFKAFADTYNLSDKDKEQLAALIEEKLKEQMDSKGGISTYEIEEPVIDGDHASVKAKVHYKDGSDEDMNFKLVNVDGKWLQEMNK